MSPTPDLQNMVIYVPFNHCGNGSVNMWICGNGFLGLWILVECGNVEMGVSVLMCFRFKDALEHPRMP
jgi:hypothetical protein